MKKILIIFTMLIFSLIVCGCEHISTTSSTNNKTTSNSKTTTNQITTQTTSSLISNLTTTNEEADLLKATLAGILDTPISPELINTEQHTEEIIGKYEIHDFILYHMLNNGDTENRIYTLLKEAFKGEIEEDKLLELFGIN